MSILNPRSPYVNYGTFPEQWPSPNEVEPSSKKQETIDFSNYSKDQILDQFKSSEWSKLEEHNRIGLLQEMENRMAKADGREPAEVQPLNGGDYGSYNDTTNVMCINVEEDKPSYEVLDSFVHEDNHAHQAYGSEETTEYDKFTENMIAVESARDEDGRLYNYERSSAGQYNPYYDMQCNEMDSNNKAARALLSESERYKDDPAYHRYIHSRAEHFKDVNENLEKLQSGRSIMQQNQIYKAYANGDLTLEEYEAMKNTLDDENHVDSMVEESKEIESQIKEMDKELSIAKEEEIDYMDFDQNSQDLNESEDTSYTADSFDYTGDSDQGKSEGMDNEADDSMSY